MRMAKPTPADIDAAAQLMQLLELIDTNRWGPASNDGPADLVKLLGDESTFDAGKREHLQALYNSLSALQRAAPGFPLRVIGGMCYVICWDENKILDPNVSMLELHPDLREGLALLQAQRGDLCAAPVGQDIPMDYPTLKQSVSDDPSVSFAIKRRLDEDLQRDPLDALRDAELLLQLMQRRWEHISNRSNAGSGGGHSLPNATPEPHPQPFNSQH